MNLISRLFFLCCTCALMPHGFQVVAQDKDSESGWIQLFNGKDLEGWVPKIRYHALGENYGNTFRVEDGLLKVGYDPKAYPEFKETFGHLFFKTLHPLSSSGGISFCGGSGQRGTWLGLS